LILSKKLNFNPAIAIQLNYNISSILNYPNQQLLNLEFYGLQMPIYLLINQIVSLMMANQQRGTDAYADRVKLSEVEFYGFQTASIAMLHQPVIAVL
jgi:hypothetical protein